MAELGWTRKAIKTVLGVTPTTMRPPYGDIGMRSAFPLCWLLLTPSKDDRVRAISLAMGMVPIMWTNSPSGGKFDTNGTWLIQFDTYNFNRRQIRLEGRWWPC